ncbi:GNAT family N-acetyltransferase [Halobacillus locisalis]|uniref:GNAT family N-acetyltransferase n=1 Tax=Halobacillus locisalis TaxID=220753 RepID=UPI001C67A2C8|nr:GNAT family N-acetyltransferase [Halobacillus locisalis]
MRLIEPAIEWQENYLSFYQEWVDSGEQMTPWVIEKDPSDFSAMVQYLENNSKGINIPDGFVPDSTFWLINEQGRVLGAVNIRHALTELLRNAGGHIGYGIRPSERQKGYATQLLRLALGKAKELGIQHSLVVCDQSNTASMKTILNNGGVEDEDFVEEDGNVVKRFWVNGGLDD